MKISELKKEDIAKVAILLTDYWKERGMEYSKKWAEDYIAKGHASEIKKEKFFVLKENKNLIGCISIVVYEGDLAELRDFVIKKEFRKKGFGKKLLEFALQWCKENKIRKIISLAFPKYKDFLEEYGFEQEGFLKDHFKDGENLILMSKKLKKEKQIDLKSELEQIEVREKTSEQLKKLPLRKFKK